MNKDIILSYSSDIPFTHPPRRCMVRTGATLLLHLYREVVISDPSATFTVTAVKAARGRPGSDKIRMYLLQSDSGEHYYTADRDDIITQPSDITSQGILTYFARLLPTGFYYPTCLNSSYIMNELVALCNRSIDPLKEAIEPFIRDFPDRRVVAAANRIRHPKLPNGELVIPSARQFDTLMHTLYDALLLRSKYDSDITVGLSEEGFIDQWGVWMDRKEAYRTVQHSKQYFDPARNVSDEELYSEGVW
jgi:hypothetical protein